MTGIFTSIQTTIIAGKNSVSFMFESTQIKKMSLIKKSEIISSLMSKGHCLLMY